MEIRKKIEAIGKKTMILDVNSRYYGLETLVLMENAGRGVADVISQRYGKNRKIGIFCGTGNNGGDGFVAARHLMDQNQVTLFLLGHPNEIRTEEAKRNWQILEHTHLQRFFIRDSTDLINHDLDQFDIIVDGMLGTGIQGELQEPYKSTVLRINQTNAKKVSIDIPTGYGSKASLESNITISFHFPKCEGAEVLSLGIPSGIEKGVGPGEVKALQKRKPAAHKGEAGRVMIIGGSAFFRGALEYAGRAAAKIADLVYHCSPDPCSGAVERIPDFLGTCLKGDYLKGEHLSEIVRRVNQYRCDSVVIGPGLGLGPEIGIKEETKELVIGLIKELKNQKLIIDADGLNAISKSLEVLRENMVLTPHRGEFRRLTGQEPTEENVTHFAKQFGCLLVVKGPIDMISNGRETKLNFTGNPGMATGGTGDILSGTIAGFAAINELFESCCASTFVVGLAGDFVKKEKGFYFTSNDVIEKLPEAIQWAEDF